MAPEILIVISTWKGEMICPQTQVLWPGRIKDNLLKSTNNRKSQKEWQLNSLKENRLRFSKPMRGQFKNG
jgi:hypothetical protein